MKRNPLFPRSCRHWTPAAVAAVLSGGVAVADPVTGLLADPFSTLVDLDAQHVSDPAAGVHFAGARVGSFIDAGFSTYSSDAGLRYWSVLPTVGPVEAGSSLQSAQVGTAGGTGLRTSFQRTIPAPNGNISASLSFGGAAHASADLSTGLLRTSASAQLSGPLAPAPGMRGLDGLGMYGESRARAELADHLTTTHATSVRLTGTWDGSLLASPVAPDLILPTSGGAALATDPISASARVVISLWSAPEPSIGSVEGGGGDGSGGLARNFLGGIDITRSITYQQAQAGVNEAFDITIAVPAGTFYFYASQEVSAGGQTTPWQVLGQSTVSGKASADFEHTLQFGLVTTDGSKLLSESGAFLTAVPEPGEWAAVCGTLLVGWGFWRKRSGERARVEG